MRRVLSLFLSLVLVSLVACGGDSRRGSGGGSGRLQVAVIPKGTTHEFWKAIHAGAVTAGKELDVEIIWKGPLREDDRDEQIKIVEAFSVRRVAGIVLAPLDDQALVPAVKDAVRAGVPVVVADSDLAWDGMVSYVATDNCRGGALAAEHLGQLLSGRGKVLLLRYMEGSASTTKREEGFLAKMAEAFPNVELVSTNQHAGATLEDAIKKSETLLTRYAELDGIFCPNESTAAGMLRALQGAGRAGKLRFVGFDASAKLVSALASGDIDGLVVQDPFAMGYRGVKTLLDHVKGRPVEKVVDTGVTMVTKASMHDPATKKLLSPELSVLGG